MFGYGSKGSKLGHADADPDRDPTDVVERAAPYRLDAEVARPDRDLLDSRYA
jgi:hypothetical protein